MLARMLLIAVATAAAPACISGLDVEGRVTISCGDTPDCPAGWVCVTDVQRCARQGANCIQQSSAGYVSVDDGLPCSSDGEPAAVCFGGECVDSSCGDEIVDARTEECDDGNDDDTDGCSSTCSLNVCGDGLVHAGVEACDDGNKDSGDGCRGDCQKIEVCGDGVLDAGEQCDDSNANPNDDCYVADRMVDAAGCSLTRWRATVRLGLGPTEGEPSEQVLDRPKGMAVDSAGNLYVADSRNNRIIRVDHGDGLVTLAAGSGEAGYAGDGGAATGAELDEPSGVFVDVLGNIFVADRNNHRVRSVDWRTGIITTIAGTGTPGTSGDGGVAIAARLDTPTDVAVDGLGNIYIADSGNDRIRRVRTDGIIEAFAGNGVATFGGDDGPALEASFDEPTGLAIDSVGNLLIADQGNLVIRRVDRTNGIITTIAGGGSAGGPNYGDGGLATNATLNQPERIALDADDNLYIADQFHWTVRKVDAISKVITKAAGNGSRGSAGDGGLATAAELDQPTGLAIAPDGDLLIAELPTRRVRRVDATTDIIETFMGSGAPVLRAEGRPATTLDVWAPNNVAVEGTSLFIADTYYNRVLRVDLVTGFATSVAGTRLPGTSPDGIAATEAALDGPWDVAVNSTGDVYIAEADAHRIRRIAAGDGTIATVAGNGSPGFAGEGTAAIDAQLNSPTGLAFDANDNLFVADRLNNRIRRIDAVSGNITTYAGTGDPGVTGDEFDATLALLDSPRNIALDDAGQLFIADALNCRVRRVDTAGIITTVAGSSSCGHGGDGELATVATLGTTLGVAVDGAGNLWIATSNITEGWLRRVDSVTDRISTVAGAGGPLPDLLGDGGPAAEALVGGGALDIDASGNVYVTGGGVRRIDAVTQTITTVAGLIDPIGDGTFARASLSAPAGWSALDDHRVLAADGISGRLRLIDFTEQTIRTVAGYPGISSDTYAPGTGARHSRLFATAWGLVFAPEAGGAFVSERDGHTVRFVAMPDTDPTTWTVSTLAGAASRDVCCRQASPTDVCDATELTDPGCVDDSPGFSLDAGSNARFSRPAGLAFEPLDPVLGQVLYVADSGNHVVRRITLSNGNDEVLAGVPENLGFFGDDGPATSARLYRPTALAIGPNANRTRGSLYVADTGNQRVRRVDLDTGVITTVVGDGIAASSGAGAPARYFSVDDPSGLFVDVYGNLFVSSRTAVRVVTAGAAGFASGDDTVSTIYGSPPRDALPESVTRCLTGIGPAPDDPTHGTVYVVDACLGFMVELSRVP